MKIRSRVLVLWLAAGFVVAGAAVGFANGASDNHGAEVSSVARPSETPPGSEHGDEVSDVASDAETSEAAEVSSSESERPENHGFFVSQAAHCEDVDTGEEQLTAPEECDSDGGVHAGYVKQVAHSGAGKAEHAPSE